METIFNTNKRPCAYTIPAWILATVILAVFFNLTALPLEKGLAWGFFILVYLGGMFRLQYFIAKWTHPETAVAFMKALALVVLVGCLPYLGKLDPQADNTFLLPGTLILWTAGLVFIIWLKKASWMLGMSWLGYNGVAILIFITLYYFL